MQCMQSSSNKELGKEKYTVHKHLIHIHSLTVLYPRSGTLAANLAPLLWLQAWNLPSTCTHDCWTESCQEKSNLLFQETQTTTVSPVQSCCRSPSREVQQLFNFDQTALVPTQCSSASICVEWPSSGILVLDRNAWRRAPPTGPIRCKKVLYNRLWCALRHLEKLMLKNISHWGQSGPVKI